MKNCRFCKKQIAIGTTECPHCRGVLIEKISTYVEKTVHHEPVFPKKAGKSWRSIMNRCKKPLLILALVALVITIYSQKPSKTIDISAPYIPVVQPSKDPATYVSLGNGTILLKNPYYQKGLGTLNIDNGTDLDAIAKLISVVNGVNKKSIYTVYIKANHSYKLNNISDGNYKLLFNLGNDWNPTHKAFDVNSGYEEFDQDFEFTTTPSENYDQYVTYEVTLNPVLNGQAKTNDIDPAEFANY